MSDNSRGRIGSRPYAETPPMVNDANRSMRTASLVAGIGLLLMAVVAAFGNFVALGGLGTPRDGARAMKAIADSEGLFRWGVASLFLVAVLDVIVAAALLKLFTPVNRSISALAAWFRVAYAGVYVVAISQLVGALPLSDNANEVLARIHTFDDIWHAGLILFGAHLLLIGYLAYRSGFVPKILGILLVVAGLGYLTDSFGAVLLSGYSVSIAQITFVGEVVLIFWLLIKGRRVGSMRATA